MSLTTPALLFPAITLLFLAYTNRFGATAAVIRELHAKHIVSPGQGVIKGQITSLKRRIELIRKMQIVAAWSFVCCVISILLLYIKMERGGALFFVVALILLTVSLLISLMEIKQSTVALNLELSDMEE